jgi:hypothetical protein
MSSATERARRGLVLFATLSGLAIVACGDDSTPPEPEPEVATIRVTVGTFTTDVPYPTGSHTPIPLVVNQQNAITFQFLGANGQPEPIIVAERANLELRMSNMATGWTFTPTGGTGATFTANMRPTATGSFIPLLQLFNSEHGHNEVDRTISVTVTQ